MSSVTTTGQINVGSFGINMGTNPINWAFWSANYISGGRMDMICYSGFAGNESYLRIDTGHYSSYNNYVLKMSTQTSSTTEFGFWANNSSSTTPLSLWFNNTSTQITSRSSLASNPHLWLDSSGVLCVGKTTKLSNSSWLEINGSVSIADTASSTIATNITSRPSLLIYDSTQGNSLQQYLAYGKDWSTSIADYGFYVNYSGSASSANNYTLWYPRGANGGLTMNGFGQIRISGRGNAYASASLATLEVVGTQPSITVPSGYSHTSTGQASIGGGAVPVCAYFGGNCWLQINKFHYT